MFSTGFIMSIFYNYVNNPVPFDLRPMQFFTGSALAAQYTESWFKQSTEKPDERITKGSDSVHSPWKIVHMGKKTKKTKHQCTWFTLLGIHRSQSSVYSNILQWKYAEHGKLCAFQGWLTKSLICKTHIRGTTSSETCRGMTSEKYYGVAQSETHALFSYSFTSQVPVEYGVKGCIAVQRTDGWFAHDSVAAAAHRRGN